MADVRALAPAEVLVRFPRSDDDVVGAATYDVTVPLESLGLAPYAGRPGFDGVQVLHASTIAAFANDTLVSDPAALQALAEQLATDFYLYRLAPVAAVWMGAAPWQLEGLSDSVEWLYRRGEVSCRVEPPAWNVASQDWGALTGPPGPPGPAGDLVVELVDTVSYPNITLIQLDPDDGVTLSSDAAGTVRIDLEDFVGAGAGARHGLVPSPTQAGPSDPRLFLCEDGTWAPPPAAAATIIVGDDEVSCPDVAEVRFTTADALRVVCEGDGTARVHADVFVGAGPGRKVGLVPVPPSELATTPPRVLAETAQWVEQAVAPPAPPLAVGDDFAAVPDTRQITFTSDDAFAVEPEGPNAVRVRLAEFIEAGADAHRGLVPAPPAAVPSVPLFLRHDKEWAEAPAAVTAGHTGTIYRYRDDCVEGVLKVYRTALNYTDGLLQTVDAEEFAYDAGCCDCPKPPPVEDTGCCTGAVPGRLFATLSGAGCFAAGVTVPLDYHSGTARWEGVAPVACGAGATFVHLELHCDPNSSPPVWWAFWSCQPFASPFEVTPFENFAAVVEANPADPCADPFLLDTFLPVGSAGCGPHCCNVAFGEEVNLVVSQ